MPDEPAPQPNSIPGIVTLRSPHSVSAAVTRLESILKARGLRVFARIDFAADAAREGLAMPPMVQLVFGNPRAGTPLLQAAPAIGLDLPLKILLWEDARGAAWLSYQDPDALVQRHQAPAQLVQNIAAIRALAEQAVAPDGGKK
jgi:uncharacterized protein (DUF302 family)